MCMMSILVLMLGIFFMSGGLGQQVANMSSCIEKERRALLDVKASLTDWPGYLISGWVSEGEKTDCCEWAGVTCDIHTGHVIKLDLAFHSYPSSNPFVGPYRLVANNISHRVPLWPKIRPDYLAFSSPGQSLQVLTQLQYLNLSGIDLQSSPLPNHLGSLSNLQSLDISRANLNRTIPPQLANLSNLRHLDLSSNFLGGSIPKSFSRLSSLIHLSIAHNSLNGSMPDFRGCPSLQYLDLSNNFLSGIMPVSVGQLSNLRYLDLSHNSLNGNIPNLIGCPSLSFLDLSSNHLSSSVPKSLGQVSNLEHLDFSSNSLEGDIYDVHFLNLTRLRYLDLSSNSLALHLTANGTVNLVLETIKLQSCKLGPRFPMWIKTQTNFTRLDISNAGISYGIPAWFWNLSHALAFLNISSNEIKGMLPDMSSSFAGSPGIDLSNNHFEGRVPKLPDDLSTLNLSGNKFSGTLSFLCDIGYSLTFLDLSNNLLSGSLPDCQLNFQNELVILNLSNNNLSGEIPSSLGFLSKLEALYLRANAFVGELPLSLSDCTNLRFVDFGENKLSGVIPEWIGEKLTQLYVLVLTSNRFKGRLPSQICWLYNLQVLDVSNNGLSGNIPRCFHNFTAMATRSFGDDMTTHSYSFYSRASYVRRSPHLIVICAANICPRPVFQKAYFLDNALLTWKGKERSFKRSGLQLLKSIDLSRNNLSGILPYEITDLVEMVSLNVSTNKLHGEVPKDIGKMKAIESLDLSRNEFSGHIPSSLSQLTPLSYLDLSYNNLSGRIPTGPQLQLFNYTSYSGNPQLCGPPLTPRCGLPPPPVTFVVKEDVEDDLLKSYYIGMGVGFSVAFVGICSALFLNRGFRYFFFSSLSYMKDWMYVTMVVHFGKLGRKFSR